jgi:hypothetical protein
MPSGQGTPVSTGIYDLDNAGTSSVTITGITLPSSHELRMTEAWLNSSPASPG